MTDGGGHPVAGALVVVDGIGHNVRTTARGEYWRLLAPGNYTVTFSKFENKVRPPVREAAVGHPLIEL